MNLEVKARLILSDHEEWLRKELQNWPYESCFDTCITIEADLVKAFPAYRFRCRDGYFYDPSWEDYGHGHFWIQGKDGTIVDPTVGQFIGGIPLRIFEPDHPACELYQDKESVEVTKAQAKRLKRVLMELCTPKSRWINRL